MIIQCFLDAPDAVGMRKGSGNVVKFESPVHDVSNWSPNQGHIIDFALEFNIMVVFIIKHPAGVLLIQEWISCGRAPHDRISGF